MKLLFENWRKYVKEAEVIDFPDPRAASGAEEYFLFNGDQLKILNNLVKKFGGSLDGLVQLSSDNLKKMVAEQDEEEPLAKLPRPKKGSQAGKPRPFFLMEPEDFEEPRDEEGKLLRFDNEDYSYVIPVDKGIVEYFNHIIQELQSVEGAYEAAKSWYYDVNNVIKGLVDNDPKDVALMSILMSACSHNTAFERNFAEAVLIFKAIKYDLEKNKTCLIQFLNDRDHFKEQKVEGKMGKLKLTNFALNILDPTFAEKEENWWNSTMDRWMIRAFYPALDDTQYKKGTPERDIRAPLISKISSSPISYIYLTKLLAKEAANLELAPHELQAIIWVSIMNKRTGRVDTLPKVLGRIKDKIFLEAEEIQEKIEQDGDQQEAVKIGNLIFQGVKNETDIINAVLQLSSENLNLKQNDYINNTMDLNSEECPTVDIAGPKGKEFKGYPSLVTYFVLDYYVGMRRDKKNNIGYYIRQSVEGKLDIKTAREKLTSLINQYALTQSKVIAEKNKQILNQIAEDLRRKRRKQ